MNAEGALAARPDSPGRRLAEALAWLWRLGPVADAPEAGRVAVGTLDEAAELAGAVAERRLAGAVILAAQPGPEQGLIPAREEREGVARFASGAAVFDTYTVFGGGKPIVRTRRGAHAILASDRVLVLGADVAANWGRLSTMWALAPIEQFLAEVSDRPLLKLPPLGSIRFDDLPGTAQHQLEGRDKSDSDVTRRIERLHRVYRAAGAKLSLAVAARALRDGEPVPPEEIWPRAVAALAGGVADGTFEPVGHGWLHYDDRRSDLEGKIEPREFEELDEDEAERRIRAVLEWQREHIGVASTFVAPAWGYSEGTIAVLRRMGMPAWHRATAAPLITDGNPHETLLGAGGRGGVHRVNYGSLLRLSEAGVPPTPVLHGGLMDDRLSQRVLVDAPGYARLLWARDAHRLPRVRGIRWISAGELVERYAAHDVSEVRDGQPVLPAGAEAVLVSGGDRRLVGGDSG